MSFVDSVDHLKFMQLICISLVKGCIDRLYSQKCTQSLTHLITLLTAFHPHSSHSSQIRKLRPRVVTWQNPYLNPDLFDHKPNAWPTLPQHWEGETEASSGWRIPPALICVQQCCVEAAWNRKSVPRGEA